MAPSSEDELASLDGAMAATRGRDQKQKQQTKKKQTKKKLLKLEEEAGT
jgi:hypothetical protein